MPISPVSRNAPSLGMSADVTLKQKIGTRSARIGVIGLGYVGLPLAVEFCRAGFDVTGFDIDSSKAAAINAGRSYIGDVPTSQIAECIATGRLRATSDMSVLAQIDVVDI